MNVSRWYYKFAIGLSIALISASSPLSGFLASVKSVGMGATGVAYPQDALVGAYNPAGMIDVCDRFDAGVFWEHFRGKTEVSNSRYPGMNGDYNPYHGMSNIGDPEFGINYMLDCDKAIGFILYNRDYTKTSYNKSVPLLGTTKLGLEYVHETFGPTFAMRFCDNHAIGISIDVHAQRILVEGVQNFDNALRSVSPGHVTNKRYDWSWGAGATLGWLWHATDCLSVGATFTPRSPMQKFHKYKGFLANHGEFDIPMRWSVGMAYKVLPCATLTFDIQQNRWANVHALNNNLLKDGVLNKLGESDGPAFGWKNQTFYRVGADYIIDCCWTVRAGYRYAKSVVRPSQAATNVLTPETVEQAITVGATWAWDCCNEISAAGAWGFEKTINGKDAIPAFLGGGNVKLEQQKWLLGVSWGHRY